MIEWNKVEGNQLFCGDWRLSYTLRTLGDGTVNAILTTSYKGAIVESKGELSDEPQRFHELVRSFLILKREAEIREDNEKQINLNYAKNVLLNSHQ
jgi:hypothetical protein